MDKVLLVIDMQNDFVDGSLGSQMAVDIVPRVVDKIKAFDGKIFVTYDTHFEDYLQSSEGKKLPVEHCIKGTAGWGLNPLVQKVLNGKDYVTVQKRTFGSIDLPKIIGDAVGEDFELELVGLCTDICVVSNALIMKAAYPENEISVDSSCCAGTSPDAHNSALKTMQSCQITVR